MSAEENPAPDEAMMLLGGELVPVSVYQRHMATSVVDPVQQVELVPAAAGRPTIGQAGLVVGPSTPDPNPLSDDERKLIWAMRRGLAQ